MTGRPQRRLASAGPACLTILAALGCGTGGETLDIRTAEVTSGAIEREVSVTGEVQSEKTVEVGSRVSGTIAAIHVDYNSQVRTGQVLAELDRAALQAMLTDAAAQVMQARSERARLNLGLGRSRTELARIESLAAQGLAAQVELDAARTAVEEAEAALTAADAGIVAAEAAVKEAQVNLEHAVIRSPIDGVVIGRHVEVGQTIAASVQAPVLFSIADLGRMRILAQVPEGDVGGVQPGSAVTFRIEPLGDQIFEGTVADVRLQPVIEAAASTTGSQRGTTTTGATTGTSAGTPAATTSGTASAATSSTSAPSSVGTSGAGGVVNYVAVVNIPDVGEPIPPGATATVTLAAARRDAVLRIPNNALSFQPSQDAFDAVGQDPPVLETPQTRPGLRPTTRTRQVYVWKFADGRFVPLLIETGVADAQWTELVSGPLAAGDTLVTAAIPARR